MGDWRLEGEPENSRDLSTKKMHQPYGSLAMLVRPLNLNSIFIDKLSISAYRHSAGSIPNSEESPREALRSDIWVIVRPEASP